MGKIKENLRRMRPKELPSWMVYGKNHIHDLSSVFLLSFLITAAFVFMKYIGGLEKFQEDFEVPLSIVSAAEFVKNDGEDLTKTLENYLWGSLHLMAVVYVSLYWIRRMSFLTERRYKAMPPLESAHCVLRILLAGGIWFVFLKTGCNTLLDVPLLYLSMKPFMYLRWMGAFLVPAILLTDMDTFVKWLTKADRVHPFVRPRAVGLLTALSCYVIVELFCESKLYMSFLCMRAFSVLYWLILFAVFHILTKDVRSSARICLGLAGFIGLGNYCVMQFRGTYVMAGDLTVIGTALEVAGEYRLVADRYLFIPAAILVITWVLVSLLTPRTRVSRAEIKQKKAEEKVFMKTPEGKALYRRRLLNFTLQEVLLMSLVTAGLASGVLFHGIRGNCWNYTDEVRENGYLPFFFANILGTSRVTLKDYHAEDVAKAIREGAQTYDTESAPSVSVKEPDIIVIQNEAFADLSVCYDYTLSEDCMPFVHSLTENTRKGYANASVTGGPTANTEFEFLTRYGMSFLPTGAVAYSQYLKREMPSLLTVLKNQEKPYYCIGYHPYHASGYNRESVYQTLGFDERIFYEDTTGMDRIRKLLSDKGDYEDVIRMYKEHKADSDNPFFMFNVTIQNHSPFLYLNKSDLSVNPITVTSFTGTKGLNNYFTLVKESDNAFRGLVEYFSTVKDPVIILMFGDHEPSWDDESTKVLKDKFLSKDKDKQTRDKYYVPYVLWANYDIDEYDGLKWENNPGELDVLSVNYLSSVLLSYAGVELSDYDRYLLNLHDQVPAITSKGWWDTLGQWHDPEDTGELTDELFKYNEICYNMLFDKKNKQWELFGQ